MGFTLYFVYPMHLMHFRQKKTYIDFFPLFLFLVKFESIQRILPFQSKKKKKKRKKKSIYDLFGSLERRRVEGRRVVRRRVEGNGYPLLCLDVFKISNGEGSNQPFLLFGCFKNQDGEERKLFKQTNLPLFENSLATLVYD